MQRGPLIILSGPSGCGKSTVIDRLLQTAKLPLRLSVSATSRQPREGERDGVAYHFWTRERFEAARDAGEFLEWANVYGNYYGTPLNEVASFRAQGIGVLLEIDVQGAALVRTRCPDHVSIFLRPPTLAELERRLRGRGTETPEVIERRLSAARRELEREAEYDFTVVNDDIDRAAADLEAIIGRQFGRACDAG